MYEAFETSTDVSLDTLIKPKQTQLYLRELTKIF